MENIMKIEKAINSHIKMYGDSDAILELDLDEQENSIFDAGYLEGLKRALGLMSEKK